MASFPERLQAALRRYARVAAAGTVAIGGLVLLGWWLHLEARMFPPSWPPMVPNAALMCVLSGASLVLRTLRPPGRRARPLASALALAAGLVAAASLLQFALGDLGIDHLLVRSGGEIVPGQPGRPSAQTAATVLLASAALLALDRPEVRGVRPAELLGLFASTLPILAALGYMLRAPTLYGASLLRPNAGMALQTVLALLGLTSGILAARPDVGLMALVTSEHAGGVMARRLLLGLSILLPPALLLEIGESLGWYEAPVTIALLVVLALAEGLVLILISARRLDRDDAARRAVEAELRRSEQRALQEQRKLHGIVSIAADAIICVDERREVVLYNEGAEQIFGWTAGELLGQRFDRLIPERFRQAHEAHLRRFAVDPVHARKVAARATPLLGLRKDGTEFHAEAAISRLELDGRQLFTVVLRDVSDDVRHLEEQTLLARVGEVLADSLDAQATIDRVCGLVAGSLGEMCGLDTIAEDGAVTRRRVVHADPAKAEFLQRRLGALPDRSASHPLWQVIDTGKPVLLTQAPAELAAEPGAPDRADALAVRSLMAVPLSARGRLIGVLTVASNHPDRRYGEGDLRLCEELARRIALALDNAHLYELARGALEAREHMLGVVAHDLRNPLSNILLVAQLFRRRGAPERRSQKNVEAIRQSALRMNRLIEDLLDVRRLESGHLAIEPRQIPTHELIADVVATERRLAASAEVELSVELADDLPAVWADRDRMWQVLENLIGNAIKFSPPGSRVTVGAAPRDGRVVFRVADTGPGIPAEDLPRLFESFWQATKTDRRGAGLGLSIAKGIVEAHGGSLWVESEVGRGTSFYFTMPLEPREGAAERGA